MPALVYKDRVKETTVSTGTGNIVLSGVAPEGFQSFSVFSTADYFYYVIDGGAEWEIGTGVLLDSTTLNRVTVLASSNSNALVSFSTGVKTVFNSLVADGANQEKTITFGIRDITTGDRLSIIAPFSGSIVRWNLYSHVVQTSSVDLKVNGYVVSSPMVLTAGTFTSSSSLIGWTTTIVENDIITATVNNKSIIDLLQLQVVVKI